MDAHDEPRLLFPKLKPFYDWVAPLTWPLIRLTVGLMILPHGWPKLMAGVTATAQFALVKRGIAPAEPLAVVLIILETIGGLCVAVALRFYLFSQLGHAEDYLPGGLLASSPPEPFPAPVEGPGEATIGR